MSDRDALVASLRQIDLDLERIGSAWQLFVKSTKDFEPEQSRFVELMNARGIGGQHNLIQMILLHDCVAAICRIMDHEKLNRVTLLSACRYANALYGQTRPLELGPISAQVKASRNSTEMAALRRFRHQYIGHTLVGNPVDAPHANIPLIATQVSDIVGAMFSLCGVGRWIGQASKPVVEERARRFWYYLERGMGVD